MTHGGKDKYWQREREKDKRGVRDTKKTGWGGARHCQEAREDRTVTFTDVPLRVKVWRWNLWSGRAEKGREVVRASLLSVKPVSASGGGVRVQGGGVLDAKLAKTPSLKFQPCTSAAKISSQFCALAMLKRGATEGAQEKHSHCSLSGKRGKEEGERAELGWGGRKLRRWLPRVEGRENQ